MADAKRAIHILSGGPQQRREQCVDRTLAVQLRETTGLECAVGNLEDAEQLQSLPVWVFHGDQHSAVPLERSVAMVDTIRVAGGTKVRLLDQQQRASIE